MADPHLNAASAGTKDDGLDASTADRAHALSEERERLLERLELAQAAAGIGIHDYDMVADRIEWDARVRGLWGVAADEPITYSIFAAGVHPDDLPAVEQAVAAATRADGDGRYLARYRIQARDGSQYHVEAIGQASFRDGQAIRLIGTVRDITSEVAAALELEKARKFAEHLVQTAPTVLYIYDLVGRRNLFIGPQIGPMTNMSAGDFAELGDELLPAVIHPDDLERVSAHHQAVRERKIEPPFNIEYRLRRTDGSWLWLASTEVVHARDEDGFPTEILGASLDVTRRHEGEALRELLIGEMAHRMKNVLSVIQSIATMTLRKGCDPEVWSAFERRVDALIAAQRLLTERDWHSVDLMDVAQTVLKPFADEGGQRIRIEGPPAQIDGRQITTLALALHELATNAVKHGALSTLAGTVGVTWKVEGGNTQLEWRESGGPPGGTPSKPGFGSAMINALGKFSSGQKLRFEPDGLVCRLIL